MKFDQALCKPTNPVGEGLAPPVWNEIRSNFIETAGASPRPTASYFIWLNFIKKGRRVPYKAKLERRLNRRQKTGY